MSRWPHAIRNHIEHREIGDVGPDTWAEMRASIETTEAPTDQLQGFALLTDYRTVLMLQLKTVCTAQEWKVYGRDRAEKELIRSMYREQLDYIPQLNRAIDGRDRMEALRLLHELRETML